MARADEQKTLDAESLAAALDAQANPEYAASMRWFFKTEPGGYGEGDEFIGLKMPVIRSTAKPYRQLSLDELAKLLASAIHEHRMAALVILSERAKRHVKRSEEDELKKLYDFYLGRVDAINNWDLVDISCRDVVGGYLFVKGDSSPLDKLARSDNLWERRISIVSTAQFIRENQLGPTFRISEALLSDAHDLIHKAVGWMLREAGKRDERALEAFLSDHAHEMPRTALRYSIERMSPERRAHWLAYQG